jgi:hypothetical protein
MIIVGPPAPGLPELEQAVEGDERSRRVPGTTTCVQAGELVAPEAACPP